MKYSSDDATTLVIRRLIDASAEDLFEYWTEPAHLMEWWGPNGVSCDSATIDLRVGGAYRIANRFPDDTVLWISGTFEEIAPPKRLAYTWQLSGAGVSPRDVVERVTVTFTPRGTGTEVVVVHERIADASTRAGHERGWNECLDALERVITR